MEDGGGNRHVDRNDNTVIDQIMLRFRPIAPRPLTDNKTFGYVLPASDLKRKRVKRKYVRVKKKVSKASERCLAVKDNKSRLDFDTNAAMIEDLNVNELVATDPVQKVSNWISFDLSESNRKDLHGGDLASEVDHRKVVESWITIESVTGACEERRLIGFRDEEIWKSLETDSCPGFISNGYDEVLWVNPAYRRMLDLNPEGGTPASEVAVWLMVKVEKSTVVKYLPAFSCRVRIEYYRSSEKKRRMMVPGDVCMMDSGGFAWLLDVRFALSLGPLLT